MSKHTPQQHAQYIGIERGHVALCCLLGDESPRPLSRSVVDGNVQAAKTLDCLIHQVAHVFFNAHICTNKFSLGPECPEFRNQCLSFFLTTTGHDNVSPLLCENDCGGASNTCQRASNQHHGGLHAMSPYGEVAWTALDNP